jgi:hypothetical protein
MRAIGEYLHDCRGSELEGHHEFARDGTLRFHRFRDVQAQEPGVIGDIVLTGANHYGVALLHEKAIAGMQGIAGRDVRGAVEIAQGQTTAAVRDVDQQAMIAPLRLDRPQETDICRKWHPATGISWHPLNIGDELIGYMVGMHREIDGPVELFVGADSAKGSALSKGLSGRYQ